MKFGIVGAGPQAREIAAYASSSNKYELDFYAVDEKFIDPKNNRHMDLDKFIKESTTPVLIGIGAPELKRQIVARIGGKDFISYVDENTFIFNKEKILNPGVVICPGVVITTDVYIGQHVLINIGATISHDVNIGDFSTIAPGATIAGGVKIGKGVFVGAGAVIKNGIAIADGSVIGAGSVVIEDILEENSVVVGVPAKFIRQNETWLDAI